MHRSVIGEFEKMFSGNKPSFFVGNVGKLYTGCLLNLKYFSYYKNNFLEIRF